MITIFLKIEFLFSLFLVIIFPFWNIHAYLPCVISTYIKLHAILVGPILYCMWILCDVILSDEICTSHTNLRLWVGSFLALIPSKKHSSDIHTKIHKENGPPKTILVNHILNQCSWWVLFFIISPGSEILSSRH